MIVAALEMENIWPPREKRQDRIPWGHFQADWTQGFLDYSWCVGNVSQVGGVSDCFCLEGR